MGKSTSKKFTDEMPESGGANGIDEALGPKMNPQVKGKKKKSKKMVWKRPLSAYMLFFNHIRPIMFGDYYPGKFLPSFIFIFIFIFTFLFVF